MKRILHNPQYSDKILQMTADTMFLVTSEGVCVDMVVHANRSFFKKKKDLIGKNLINEIPKKTLVPLSREFKKVVKENIISTRNYELSIDGEVYFFKCIMHPFEEGLILCQYRDITSRNKIKLELEKTNNELREIEKAAQIGQWRYEYKTQMFYYKGHTGAMSCCDYYKSIPMADYLAIMHIDDRPRFVEWINNAQIAPQSEPFEYRILWRKKNVFLRLKILNYDFNNGHEIVEGYCQNMTDFIKKDEDLEIVTRAVNYASEDIFAIKPDGTLTFANKQFRKHYLLTDDVDLSTVKINKLPVSKELKERWMKIQKEFTCLKDIIRYIGEKPFPHLKNVLAYDFFSYQMENKENEIIIWTFGRDISDRIRYEAQVNEVNQIMNTVLENLPIAISVKDTGNDMRYIYRNRVVFDKMKTTDVIGKTDFDIYPDFTAITLRNEDLSVLKDKIPISYEKETIDNNENKYITFKKKVLVENGERAPLIIAMESNITDMKRMEHELIKAKEKAENSDKLKSAFLANMSHEIRTPLNAIVGFSRVIAETQNANERMGYYNIVESNNIRLLQLINEILDLSRIESGIMEFTEEPINLNTMCQEVFDAHRFRCPENVELIYEKSDPDLWIYSDKNRLIQVFSNLIGNAMKFTKQGSISFGYELKDNLVICKVKDTGIGLPKDKANHIFERFAKLNSVAQGTGLGLSICKSIVEKLGGTIKVTSIEGAGSEFTFTHPYIQPAKENKANKVEEKENGMMEGTSFQGKKDQIILVAEDNDSNFKLLNAMIGKSFTLIHAHDGIEAITMFEEYRPNLILMDIKMPNMDGLDATKVIREVSPKIPIIALSAFVYNEDVKAALNCGCNEFIPKPVSQTLLIETLKKYL